MTTERENAVDALALEQALGDIGVGIWSFEMDEGSAPRMYGNGAMDKLLGCDGTKLTPEEYYHAWYDQVDPQHYDEVHRAVDGMIAGSMAEVQYPFNHPTRGTVWVRCGGRRDAKYTKGIRIVGRHQDISELIHVEKKGVKELAAARRQAEIEQERADKERCISRSLETLVADVNLTDGLEKVMADWCRMLGAQWCYLGQWLEDRYYLYHSYVAPGAKALYETGSSVPYLPEFNDTGLYHGTFDYVALPDFKNHPIAVEFTRLAPHPEVMQEVASCYSHLIRYQGKPWGTLVLMFRDRHVFTPDEERFFTTVVHCVQLVLMRQTYQRELEQERDRVLAAERAKSLFFSSVSHDIRTPLNAIIGFSELLEQGVEDAEERRRFVSSISSSGKMLGRLVNDLLDLSKLESGKLEILNEPTNVPALVQEVMDSFEVTKARTTIDFTAQVEDMPRMSVDPQRIRQILHNLISNAFKYTNQGQIAVHAQWRNDTLTLSVADTGKGISQENVARILQPFVQVADRNHRDGTGLGLSICQRLAHLMGGELTVRSEVGKGSTFTITVHAVEVTGHAGRVTLPEEVGGPAGRVTLPGSAVSRVLVVDDSMVNLLVMKATLARCGVAEVVTASNGREALELLRRDAAFDAVFTDLWMPELDGEGLMKAIREEPTLAHLPVYLLTADVETVAHHKELGFRDILLKPVPYAQLKALVGQK